MKKMQINQRLYNVIDNNDYYNNYNNYNPKFTALECCNGQYVLPLNSRPTDTDPGVYWYDGGMINVINKPDNVDEYKSENVIDYSKANDIGDIIKYNELIRDIQNDIITTSDNILKLNISDDDTPAMKGLKTVMNAKAVDKKQYEDRFTQFQNDMRLLRGHSITLDKLTSISSAFDISVLLTFKDKEGVPNPIGYEYTVDLTDDEALGVS